MNILAPDDIDFSAYLHETDAQQKVKSASLWLQDLIDNLGKPDTSPRAYLPWGKTRGHFQFRPGEVTLWAGQNGQGKSLVTGQTVLGLCAQGERSCIASFEMKPRMTLQRMSRQWARQDLRGLPLDQARDLYEQFRDWAADRLWLYDQQGTVSSSRVIAMTRYCAKELGIKHIVIDSLMKCVKGEDDYNGQKEFVDELCALARDNDVHVHLVHHTKKLESDDAEPNKNDVKGSGSIADQVDNVLMVWRNKRKERDLQKNRIVKDSDPDAQLICCKQRNGEWEGSAHLWFDRDSQQFVGAHDANPIELYNLEKA